MITRTTTSVLLILLAFAPSFSLAQTLPTSRQAAPMSADDLPDSVLHGDVYAVAVLDLARGDKTAWNNAAAVIMGGQPSTRPLTAADPLPMGLDQSLGPIFATGADRVVLGVIWSNNNRATVGLRLPPNADDAPARKWLRSIAQGNTIERQGQWLILQRAVDRRAAISPHADEIRQDLSCWGDDVPFRILYVPTPSMRPIAPNSAGGPPRPIAEMFNLFISAKYLYVGGLVGSHPQLEIRWAAADETGADAVIKQFQTSLSELKQNSRAMGLPPFFAVVFQQFNPVREGSTVRVSLNQRQLATMFTQVLIASAVNNNNQPGGQENVIQSPVAADWTPTDAASDAAAAQMRLILQAIRAYDQEHQSLPKSLDDLIGDKLLPGPEIFHDPRTGKDNGFDYVKPDGVGRLSDIASPQTAALLFEDKDGKADPLGLVGHSDGSVGNGK